MIKKTLLVLSTLALIGCTQNEKPTISAKTDHVSDCLTKIKEKGNYTNFLYSYEKLENYNYDYSYERTKDDSTIDTYSFVVYEKDRVEWICFVEYIRNETINVNAYKVY